MFSFSRPFIKRALDGSEESFTAKTYLTTEAVFPTVLRRSEVVESQTIEISPLESALADLELKTRELAGLYMRYTAVAQTGQVVSTNPFSMTLNSYVDTPDNAGVALYRRTFLSPEYVSSWPGRLNQVEDLRKVIDEHVCANLKKKKGMLMNITGHDPRDLLTLTRSGVPARNDGLP